jgi:hypothetical protein
LKRDVDIANQQKGKWQSKWNAETALQGRDQIV